MWRVVRRRSPTARGAVAVRSLQAAGFGSPQLLTDGNGSPSGVLTFDPWGNRIEIVGYDNIQFTKAPHVLRGMGVAHLAKNDKAIKELSEKGMAPS